MSESNSPIEPIEPRIDYDFDKTLEDFRVKMMESCGIREPLLSGSERKTGMLPVLAAPYGKPKEDEPKPHFQDVVGL